LAISFSAITFPTPSNSKIGASNSRKSVGGVGFFGLTLDNSSSISSSITISSSVVRKSSISKSRFLLIIPMKDSPLSLVNQNTLSNLALFFS
jgi:hypothetical protein